MSLKRVLSLGFILLILLLGFTTIKPILASSSSFIFNHNLSLGSINNDVKQLQIYLNNNGFILAKTGPGSKGKETTKFAALTKAALIKFQKVNKIKPSVGYFGPITRDFINKKIKKQNTIINNTNNNNTNTNTNNNNQTNNSNNNQTNNTNTNNTNPTTNNFHFGGGGLPSYTLTYMAGDNGTISGTTPQTVNYGSDGVAITATPNTGYYFVSWSDGVLTAERTDTNITSNLSLTATFAINSYTLTYTAGTHGTITGTSPQTINYGSDATTVTATPDTGYYFVSWSDGVLTAQRTDTNIIANKSVTANFTNILTYTAGTHGTITGTSPQTVNYGSNGTAVTAIPDTGYYFVSWSDGVLTATRVDTNINNNLSVTANFAINSYTLTYAAATHGTITGTTPQTINYGSNGTAVTAVADTGYHFVNWSDSSTTNPRTDTSVAANISVTANFAINTYTLTYTAGTHGTITGTTPQTINYGSNGTAVTAVPDTGYHFVNWSDSSTTNPRTDTNVTGNISVTANFAINSFTCGDNVSYGGESYPTVSIGNQCWFAKNLDIGTMVTSGSSEPSCHDVSGLGYNYWSCQNDDNKIEKYCYNNNPANCATNGGLYEWAEALGLPYDCNYANSYYEDGDTSYYVLMCLFSGDHSVLTPQQGICPTGWHIPSFTEYQTLAQNADPGCDLDCDNGDCSCQTAGDKLKATASHTPIAWDGTDIYNFSALPSGYRNYDGSFVGSPDSASVWSSTFYSLDDSSDSWFLSLSSGDPTAGASGNTRISGYSVRCVKN